MPPALRRITHGRPVASIPIDGVALAHAVHHRANAQTPEHAHARASLTLILSGGFKEDIFGHRRVHTPMSVLFKPPALPHASCTSSRAAQTITLEIDDKALPPELLHLQHGVIVTATQAARAMLRIARELVLAAESPRTCPAPEDAAHALTDCLARIAASVRAQQKYDTPDNADPGECRLAAALNTLTSNRASVHGAATMLDMHPVAFARAVRARFDCSPTEHRHRARIARATAALAHTPDSIAAVAHDAGFSDQAHLTRLFKRETGITPGAYRTLLRRAFPGT